MLQEFHSFAVRSSISNREAALFYCHNIARHPIIVFAAHSQDYPPGKENQWHSSA